LGIGEEITHDNSEDKSGDAHKIALEFAKQIISLSSGVLALSATFIKELPNANNCQLVLLAISWISLAVAIFSGLQTISAIVKSRLNSDYDWSKGAGKNFAITSKYSFFIGIILFALFAFTLLNTGQ
jgi:hypothetical protein